MNQDTQPKHDPMPDWYDPFAEPRTLPAGWDVSSLSAAPNRSVAPSMHTPKATMPGRRPARIVVLRNLMLLTAN